MPTYNLAPFIAEAINSVMSQTYTNWELIIVDDGSKDNTKEIVKDLTSKSTKIRYISFEKNKGISKARNHGISLAKGQFLAFLDSDDVWLKEKLEIQTSFLIREKEASFVFSSYRRMSSNGKKVSSVIPAANRISRDELFKGNNIPLLTVIINREHFDQVQFNEKVKTCEDYCLWLDLLKKTPFAHGIDVDLARYRHVENSVSNGPTGCVLGVMYIYFYLEFESVFLSFNRFFQYAMNGVKKRVLFPINLDNPPRISSEELLTSIAHS